MRTDLGSSAYLTLVFALRQLEGQHGVALGEPVSSPGNLSDPLITSLPYLVVLRILPNLKAAFKQGSQNGAVVGMPATCLCMHAPRCSLLVLCKNLESLAGAVTLEQKPSVWVL